MHCDFYIQTELVIEYIDVNGANSKTHTDRKIENFSVSYVDGIDSDDDFETIREKHELEVQTQMNLKRKTKHLFSNGKWAKESYKKRYESYIYSICPRMEQLTCVYKSVNTFKYL